MSDLVGRGSRLAMAASQGLRRLTGTSFLGRCARRAGPMRQLQQDEFLSPYGKGKIVGAGNTSQDPNRGGRASSRAARTCHNRRVYFCPRLQHALGFANKTDREDPTSPNRGKCTTLWTEGYVGQAAIPPVRCSPRNPRPKRHHSITALGRFITILPRL
jgi:hypothetical protein